MRLYILPCAVYRHQERLQCFLARLHKVADKKALVTAKLFATPPAGASFHSCQFVLQDSGLFHAHEVMHLHMDRSAMARHFLDAMNLAVPPGFPLNYLDILLPGGPGYVSHRALAVVQLQAQVQYVGTLHLAPGSVMKAPAVD